MLKKVDGSHGASEACILRSRVLLEERLSGGGRLMARAIWKGSISFGLVNIPVGLYTAESREDISFKLLDKNTMSPIHYKRVSEESGKEVPWDETVRGYPLEGGKYVVLS